MERSDLANVPACAEAARLALHIGNLAEDYAAGRLAYEPWDRLAKSAWREAERAGLDAQVRALLCPPLSAQVRP